jgi:hypothetical protein
MLLPTVSPSLSRDPDESPTGIREGPARGRSEAGLPSTSSLDVFTDVADASLEDAESSPEGSILAENRVALQDPGRALSFG